MIYVNVRDASDTAMVWITHVENAAFSRRGQAWKNTEWPDANLLEGIREHNPRIEGDSEVVAIHH